MQKRGTDVEMTPQVMAFVMSAITAIEDNGDEIAAAEPELTEFLKGRKVITILGLLPLLFAGQVSDCPASMRPYVRDGLKVLAAAAIDTAIAMAKARDRDPRRAPVSRELQ